LSDTQKIVYEEWKEAITLELSKKEYQADLQKAITEGPSEYRKAVERSERELEPEEMTVEQEKALKDRVNRRMMTESPGLMEHKVKNDGGKLVPDFKAHEREKRKKEFAKW
jgi:hypothetical protein